MSGEDADDFIEFCFTRLHSYGTVLGGVLDRMGEQVNNARPKDAIDLIWNGMFPSKDKPIPTVNPIKTSLVHPTRRITNHLVSHWVLLGGLTFTSGLLYYGWRKYSCIEPHLPLEYIHGKEGTPTVIILGDMNDPLIRSQVMDLYRRGYMIVIVSRQNNKIKAKYQNETDFLKFIDLDQQKDQYRLKDWILSRKFQIASILFMPNLSYYSTGETSIQTCQNEINNNVLFQYDNLLQIIHLLKLIQDKTKKYQLIFFNSTIPENLNLSPHPIEIIISGMIHSIYQNLTTYKNTFQLNMVNVGLLQIRGQLSNYKYLSSSGEDILKGLHEPIYQVIRKFNGNWLQKVLLMIQRFLSGNKFYMGRYSYVSTVPCFKYLLKLRIGF